jgi:hypothetical protein
MNADDVQTTRYDFAQEVEAMKTILIALSGFQLETQARMLRYIIDRLELGGMVEERHG